MRWLMNGMVSGGGTLSQLVDEAALLQTSLRELQAKGAERSTRKPFTGGIGKNDPVKDGWILVVPDDDEGRRIAAALAPLIEHRTGARRRDRGPNPREPADVVRFLPADQATPLRIVEWVQKQILFPGSGGEDAPFYVLVAGPPAKLPFELEHLVSPGDHCVGRLAFPDLGAYADYAAKVVAWEPDDDVEVTPRTGAPVGVFATDHGVLDPTHLSSKFLASPLLDWLEAKDPSRKRVACLGEEASRDALLGMLRGDVPELAGPRLLFSASHGLAVPGSSAAGRAERLGHQGAVCCQDAMYLESEILTADALGGGGLLPGGIWMLFACFGAGTPAASNFFRSLGDPTLLGFHDGGPFVAALPARLLADPDGPLAVIGHLDPGFSHSFSDPDGIGGERRSKINRTVRWLLEGCRAGIATGELNGAANTFRAQLLQMSDAVEEELGMAASAPIMALGAELAKRKDDAEVRRLGDRLVDLAVSLNDFRNFTILGDPAVKLPRAGARPMRAAMTPAPAGNAAHIEPSSRATPPPDMPAPIVEAKREGRLVLATAEQLFSAQGVGLKSGVTTVIALVTPACTDVAEVRERPSDGETAPEGKARRYYEAIEHQDCDLAAELRFSESEAYPAPRIRLPLANGVRLRYGEAISLFGDFYAIPGVRLGDGEQAFERVFATFEHGDPREMCRILYAMRKERAVVEDAEAHGDSVSAAYARAAGELNGDYNRATGGGQVSDLLPRGRFLVLAGVNFDHFGADAVAAYRAGHAAACRAASLAREAASEVERRCLLERAYLMNAGADHFLTDLFASGHLRVPRRVLHEHGWIKMVGDLLSKRMHDEDNGLGLVVKNRRGKTWRSYGDQHFHAEEHEVGRGLAREAVQVSAAEVWAAFEAPERPPMFEALEIVPDVADAVASPENHAPLFIFDGEVLRVRKRLEDPGCREHTADFSGVWTLLQSAAHGGF
jgi:hypothetical protein